jgi:hypothetical protein
MWEYDIKPNYKNNNGFSRKFIETQAIIGHYTSTFYAFYSQLYWYGYRANFWGGNDKTAT